MTLRTMYARLFGVVSLLIAATACFALDWPAVGVLLMMVGLFLLVLTVAMCIGECLDVCGYCGEWQAVKCTKVEITEQKKCFGIVVRRSYSTQRGAIYGGSKLGIVPTVSHEETEWEERVPLIRTTTARHCHCEFCGVEWVEEVTDEVEDFEPDEPLPPLPSPTP